MRRLSFLRFTVLIVAILFAAGVTGQTNNNQTKQTTKMKDYILLNRVPLNYGSNEARAVINIWNEVTDKWKADGIFVSSYVFPNEGFVISGAEKKVSKETVSSNNLRIVSVIVIKAANYDDATEQAKNCPTLQQGGTVEVSEIIVRPTQGN